MLYTDFSKAFDKINHSLLLVKLDMLGFPSALLRWLSSYLNGRTQRVSFRGSSSRIHLGAILFTIYLNDLPSIVRNSRILMYADDVKLFLSLNSLDDSCLLQDDLSELVKWCEVNFMSLNLKKCKKMSFSRAALLQTQYFIDDYRMETVDSFNDLGVLLDRRLNFNLHIDSCVNRAFCLLGFIKRWSREFNDPYLAKRLFTSLVRPILEYGSVLWSPNYRCHVDRIESVQKQFLIFALRGLGWNDLYDMPPYIHRLKLIDLPNLERRRLMLDIVFMVKLVNGEIDSPFLVSELSFVVPRPTSRYFIPLKLHTVKYNYEAFNPFYNLCKKYNDMYFLFSSADSLNMIKRSILYNYNP